MDNFGCFQFDSIKNQAMKFMYKFLYEYKCLGMEWIEYVEA